MVAVDVLTARLLSPHGLAVFKVIEVSSLGFEIEGGGGRLAGTRNHILAPRLFSRHFLPLARVLLHFNPALIVSNLNYSYSLFK